MDLLTLRTSHATATLSPYGAQVMSFIPTGGTDVLWQTTPEFLAKALAGGKALRGGIPLCWPWFGGHNSVAGAPSHGLGRTFVWKVTHHTDSSAILTCQLDGTNPVWPYKTSGTLTVTLTDTLTVSLTTTNLSETPFRLTQALHTYFRVDDITTARLTGTAGLTQRHVTSGTPLPPASDPFPFAAEVESLVSPVTSLTLNDQALSHRTTVTNTGTDETIIWNPWIEKTLTLDMPPLSYRNMLCLEAANVDHAPTLAPGQSYTLSTTIASRPL